MNKILKLKNFIEKSNIIHNNKYDYSLVDYVNIDTKIKIICPEHGIFEQIPYSHMKGFECFKCGINKKKKANTFSQEEIIKLFVKKHGTKYNYEKVKYENAHKKVIVCCPIHGNFLIKPIEHYKGIGCRKCGYETIGNLKRLPQEKFIERCKAVHDNKYDYSLVIYQNMDTKVKIICAKHGIYEKNPWFHLHGAGCPRCECSYGEQRIERYLKNNNIKYIPHKRFESCKNKRTLPFDFYLSDFNICIEYDGPQHFKVCGKEASEENLKATQFRDSIKTNWCKANQIELIRIPYTERSNIETILDTKLHINIPKTISYKG